MENADLKLHQPMGITVMLRCLPDSFGGLVTTMETRLDTLTSMKSEKLAAVDLRKREC